MGRERPLGGRAEVVASNAVTQFFEQDQANVLPLEKTVMQTMEEASAGTDWVYEQVATLATLATRATRATRAASPPAA